jgi:hypothetical protein
MELMSMLDDLRYAARSLVRRPGLLVVSAVTLSVGIAANAVTFGVVDQLLLRPPAHIAAPGAVKRIYFRDVGRVAAYLGKVNVGDWYFARRQPVFLLIHLADGSLVGGYWGERSHASSYPEHGDLYLSSVYKMNEEGHFEGRVDGTDGLLIRKDQYSYVELFRVPTDEVEGEQEDAEQSGR